MMQEATPSTAASPSKGGTAVFLSRLVSTLVLWTVMVVALALRLDWPLVVLAAVLGIMGALEYASLDREDVQARPFMKLLLLLSASWWIVVLIRCVNLRQQSASPAVEALPMWIDAAFLAAAVFGTFMIVLSRPLEGRDTLWRIFTTVFAFVYTTLAFGFLARILFFPGTESGAHLMLLVVAVVKFGDMGAYAIGSWVGRHKMIPHISPAKSWEGAGGAVLGSLLAALLMMLFDRARLSPLNWSNIFPLALLLCLAGILGDLAESVLKRCHRVKDSGHAFPGIGGILDLTDSLLFAAPVAYFYLMAIS